MNHRLVARALASAAALVIVVVIPLSQPSGATIGNDPVYALTSANHLLTFDPATPQAITADRTLTGLRVGERLVGMDVRPANRLLYAVGNRSGLYTIDPATGAATFRTIITGLDANGATIRAKLVGRHFGIDFNPVVDRLRIVSNAEQNFRVNVDTGMVVDADPTTPGTQFDRPLAFVAGDPNEGRNPSVVGAAYTNNDANPLTDTTLYDIDSAREVLAIQNPPNDGALRTVGSLQFNTNQFLGFDVSTGLLGDTAYASLTSRTTGLSSFYTVDLGTGRAGLVGLIGSGFVVVDIAVAQSVPT
ncbi:MAG: DUF4394 domain-containing protein [Acidimicrobiales bacterium]